MHYHCEVWLPKLPDPNVETIENVIDRIFAPYHEEGNSKYAFYDWYQIGGRYCGRHTGYKPWEDPANQEICSLCGGTGQRRDMKVNNGCNGCSGHGITTKWPSSWVRYEHDAMALKDVRDDCTAYTVIIAKGRWPKIIFTFDGNVKALLKEHGITDGYLVTVDYHS